MTKVYKKTFENLTNNLTEVKKAKLKEIIFEIIDKWRLEMRENRNNFTTAFLSYDTDKYFNKIKKAVGEFKGISKMSVLDFLARVILGYGEKENELFKELHEECERRRDEFNLNYSEIK